MEVSLFQLGTELSTQEIRNNFKKLLDDADDISFVEATRSRDFNFLMGLSLLVPALGGTCAIVKYGEYWVLEIARKAPKPGVAKSYNVDDYDSDVVHLCQVLGEQVESNGYKVHNSTSKEWLDSMRLTMVRAEELDVNADQVEALIMWATQDDFWRLNIRSAKSFRRQYDALREKANAEMASKRPVTTSGKSIWD